MKHKGEGAIRFSNLTCREVSKKSKVAGGKVI